jgi:hypothetical protein
VKLLCKILRIVSTLAAAALIRAQDVSGPLEARQIAKDAYVYGFPIVENYRVQYSRFGGGWNAVTELPRSGDPGVSFPSLDTLNAYVPVDLRAEPMVIEILPHNDDRYYTIQFSDLYTYNFAHLGSRISNTNLGVFLLAGPNWKPFKGWQPVGVYQVFRCETDLAFLFYRTVIQGPGDFNGAAAVRQDFRIYPLSHYNGEPPVEGPARIPFMPPLSVDKERESIDFFNQLNFLLQFCAADPSERDLMARFAKIGIGPGLTFEPRFYEPEIELAIRKGVSDAWKACDDAKKQLESGALPFSSLFGSRQELGNNYIYRMLGAVEGLNSDSSIETIEHRYMVDASGEKLNGKNGRYRLHFGPDRFPPVNAVWSVTLYGLPSKQFFPNPLGLSSLSSMMAPALTRDPDGGLTMLIQNEAPEEESPANWLPAPKGPFLLSLRLYAPKPEAFQGSWAQPALKKL